MSDPTLTKTIKNLFIQKGFSLVGVTKPSQLPDWQIYCKRLDQEEYGDMHYLHKGRDLRRDLYQLLPSARSVIMTALHYNSPIVETMIQQYPDRKIARFAWGTDYHSVVKTKLKQLSSEIRYFLVKEGIAPLESTFQSFVFCDTAPILEKAYAQQAGLGWIGKNGLLIHPKLGSYFVFGGMAINVDLQPDSPMPSRCGRCTMCQQSCPTNALEQPYCLDATKCISYRTIEAKTGLLEGMENSASVKPTIGSASNAMKNQSPEPSEWIFGCDRCQEVCPFNRRPHWTQEQEFIPSEDRIKGHREAYRLMNEEEFHRIFKHSGIHRIKFLQFKQRVQRD